MAYPGDIRKHKLSLQAALLPLIVSFIIFLSGVTIIHAAASITIDVKFDYVRQGRVGIILLSGPDLSGATAEAVGYTYRFFPTAQGYAGLLAIPMTQKIGNYSLTVTASHSDGSTTQWEGTLKVTSGQFVTEPNFAIPSNKAYLLRDAIEKDEETRLLRIYGLTTTERFWDGPFLSPVDGALTSPFGSVRTYTNDGVTRRHTGSDLHAATGTPILAASSGRIVLARPLAIHGNNIIIDHGWGVFSEYAHLSQIYVVPGEMVAQGEIIGLSGNTGRSGGPHLHWEIAVNGVRVDPMTFLQLKLPI